MPTTEEQITTLAQDSLGLVVSSIDPIEAGLGQRRFFRVHFNPEDGHPDTAVARVEAEEDPALRPPGIPPEPPLAPVLRLFEDAGIPVPTCYAQAGDVMLLEDVGDTSLEQAASGLAGGVVQALYQEACSYLPRLQRIAPVAGAPSFGRRLDDALFAYKAEQVIEWVLPWGERNARMATAAEADAVRSAFDFVARVAADAPQRLSHRDYKAANLHLRPGAAGSRLVLIDLQGALLAPPEYDLVCLLRDSHVELDEAFVQSLLNETRPELPNAPDAETFARRFTLLTLTRNGKDLARYLYAARTRGDTRYLALLPRAVRTLREAADRAAGWDPCLARLAEIFATLPESTCAE